MLQHSFRSYFLAFISLCCSQTSSTPIHNHLEANSPQCPVSWFQYRNFCVTNAPAGSERAVALYCDALGGIGVNGICVIKARDIPSGMGISEGLASLFAPGALADMDRRGKGIKDEDKLDGESVCPEGWAHYKSMCVYRPEFRDEKCYDLEAVPFHGMCLKHAELRATSELDSEAQAKQEKRICCCSHPDAIHNSYGC